MAPHHVDTVAGVSWAGITDGRLLHLAAHRYDAFLTMDRSIEQQQNYSNLQLRIVVLRAPSSRLLHLRPLVPSVLNALDQMMPGQLRTVAAALA